MSYAELKPFVFGALFAIAQLGFFYSLWRMTRLAALGGPHPHPLVDVKARIKDLLVYVFLQKRVVDRPFGWNHVLIFWAFLIITVGHVEFIIGGVIPAFTMDLLPKIIAYPILIGSDVLAFLVLFALAASFYRRIFVKPWFIHDTVDGFAVLGLITLVMVTYFLSMSAGIALERPELIHHASALPVSNVLAGVWFEGRALSTQTFFYETFWWAHAFVLFFFLNYIPYSKHQHLVGSFPNVFLREGVRPKGALTRLDFEGEVESFGAGKVSDLSWKQLVDTYACTECGRCDLNCPATNTNKPLEPQQLIHDIKGNLYANGDPLLASRPLFQLARAPKDFEPALPLVADSEADRKVGLQTSPEVLWSCTTCGGCIESCPVLIDHVGAIIDMRRYRTLTLGDIPHELTKTFSNIENNYNPWGIGHDKRADWAADLGLKSWGSSEDAGKFEYLLWVGCAGSYDNRAQKTTKALVRILEQAGLSYAILGTAEKCTGDPARRTGNEYLFDSLAKENVQTLNDFGVKKVVTQCPHCFNTLKNEYPAFGGNYEVLHHTQLIDQLVSSGKVRLDGDVTKRATYHDPCYLGRWNDEYEAPRRTLAGLKHLNVVEMERNKRTSMCCGAGGGQMWMEEKLGTRVNNERTRQALETGAQMIAVGCPFCMTMLEDGVKGAGKEESVQVLDLAELVDKAMIKRA
jgi:Fe-S oxidoreductase